MANDLVIRGGYGQFSEYFGRFARGFGGGPFEITEDYQNEIVNGQPLFSFPNPFPDLSLANVPSQNIEGYPQNNNNGVIHQFNLSVEKQIQSIGFPRFVSRVTKPRDELSAEYQQASAEPRAV